MSRRAANPHPVANAAGTQDAPAAERRLVVAWGVIIDGGVATFDLVQLMKQLEASTSQTL